MSNLAKEMLKGKLPPLYSGNTGLAARKINRRRDYTPVSWDKYFDTYRDVKVSDGSIFRVYLKGTSGPLLLFLHGGGYSGLSWSLLSTSISQFVECQVAALDCRGHGETHSTNEDDLSAERLSSDVGEVFNTLYGDEEQPNVILIGHSMGGAVAVHAVYRNLIPTVIGLIVIDVVEGTAMDALQSMQSFLRSRPPSFTNLQTAIEWCVRSGQIRNVESAKVSMPGQLKNSLTGNPATKEIHLQTSAEQAAIDVLAPRQVAPSDSIMEEAEEDEEHKSNSTPTVASEDFKIPPNPTAQSAKYVWRIELSKTEKFWNGWFEGLSNMFLSTSVPKLLLLAGVDRLDKDLTIGQMQGKFQMQVLPQCGHAVHEDDPDKVAEAIATFLVRNKFTSAICDFQSSSD
ncbi:protein phosphatase methylesterase 1 isoform X2 [Parasteatoda tepidariorum]|uniref:protein phosphatase methylesterase 1 isoform X2 n=1 Tax=Parasteatoda tepidariorum TaxID=114398 RepID=UPI00077FA6BE|nr:protein phosphatase methylesterase 1 isoform X2 [Parasteatoda tepidariorum]